MKNEERIKKRDEFVKLLQADLEKGLDFDFSREEMIPAFLAKYTYNYYQLLLFWLDNVSNVAARRKSEAEKFWVTFEIGEVREDSYDIIVFTKMKNEEHKNFYTFKKTPEDKVGYVDDNNFYIQVGNVKKRLIVSVFYPFYLFINSMTTDVSSFFADVYVMQSMFKKLNLKNLQDVIDLLQNHLWLPAES